MRERGGEASDGLLGRGRIDPEVSPDPPVSDPGRVDRVGCVDQDDLAGAVDVLGEDVGAPREDLPITSLDQVDLETPNAPFRC